MKLARIIALTVAVLVPSFGQVRGTGKVTSVIDGDTIRVKIKGKNEKI